MLQEIIGVILCQIYMIFPCLMSIFGAMDLTRWKSDFFHQKNMAITPSLKLKNPLFLGDHLRQIYMIYGKSPSFHVITWWRLNTNQLHVQLFF